MSVKFTLQNIQNLIAKAVTNQAKIDPEKEIFLFSDIVEEVIFIDKLIQCYKSNNKTVESIESELREAVKKRDMTKDPREKQAARKKIQTLKKTLFNQMKFEKEHLSDYPTRNVFNPSLYEFDMQHSKFVKKNCFFDSNADSKFIRNGIEYNCSLFSPEGKYDPKNTKCLVRYHGIFDLNVPVKDRTVTLHKLDETWGFSFWRQFYSVNVPVEDLDNIKLINSFLILYTEMTRVITMENKRKDIQEAQANGKSPKEINVLKETLYWNKCDKLKEDISKHRKHFDTFRENDEVFKVITELYNGSIEFYDGNQYGYPCKHFRHPKMFNNWKDGVEWCFKNISELNAPFIRGYLKNFIKIDTIKLITIHDSDSPDDCKTPYLKTTPYILLREFLRCLHDGNVGNSDVIKKNRLRTLDQLTKVFKERFMDFPCEKNSTFNDDCTKNEFSYIAAEQYMDTILALEIIITIDQNAKLLLIESQEDVKLLDTLLEFAIECFKRHGCETLKYVSAQSSRFETYKVHLHELLVYFGISPLDWIEFKDYENLFKSFGKYLPTAIHQKLMECEDYEYEFEKESTKRALIGFTTA